MRVNQTAAAEQAAQTAQTARVKKTTTDKDAFARALAKASSTTETQGVSGQNTDTKTYPNAPQNETYQDVEGKRAYDEIISGRRNGMFVNTSGNERHGQAFTLVKREGRDIHIYGSGKNREIVVVWHDKLKAAAEAKAQAKAEAEGTSAA